MTLPVTESTRAAQAVWGLLGAIAYVPFSLALASTMGGSGWGSMNGGGYGHVTLGPLAWGFLIGLLMLGIPCAVQIGWMDYASANRDDPEKVARAWLILMGVLAAWHANQKWDQHQNAQIDQRLAEGMAYERAKMDYWAPGGPGWGPSQGKGPR